MYLTRYTNKDLLVIYNRMAKTVMGTIIMGMFCLNILLAGIFPTDVTVEPPIPRGIVHGYAALLALYSLGISMKAWGRSFTKKTVLKAFPNDDYSEKLWSRRLNIALAFLFSNAGSVSVKEQQVRKIKQKYPYKKRIGSPFICGKILLPVSLPGKLLANFF